MMADRLTPAMRAEIFDMLANAANEASDHDPHPLAALAKAAENMAAEEAARREGEAPVVTGLDHSHSGDATAWWRDCLSAPPPPAPDDLVARLRAFHASKVGIPGAGELAVALEAADAIEALRYERDAALAYIKSWETEFNWMARAEAAEADAKRLREMLPHIIPKLEKLSALLGPEDSELRCMILPMVRRALAQGGNDDQAA